VSRDSLCFQILEINSTGKRYIPVRRFQAGPGFAQSHYLFTGRNAIRSQGKIVRKVVTKFVTKFVMKNVMKSVMKNVMKSDFPYDLPSRFTITYYPEMFASALEKLLTGLRVRLMAETRLIPSHELPLFFDEILQRYLGLHLKLLFEEDFFPGISKMELCKAITKFFSTVNQSDISFRILKNAMDAPREQALEMFMEKWAGYLDKATDMKVMNRHMIFST